MMEKIRKKLIREKAVIATYQYLLIGASHEEILEYLNSDKNLRTEKEEVTYCMEFISCIIDNVEKYRNMIINLLKEGWTIDRLSTMEVAILLVATHELIGENTDKKVVINEAVELTKKYCDDQSYKYINGVLNQIG